MIRTAFGLTALLWSTGAVACGPEGVAMQSDVPDAPELRVTLPDIPVAQPFGLTLLYCDDTLISLEVAAIMPAHQHGMNYQPTVKNLGDGRFAVEGMVFHMPGEWEVQVEVQTAAGPVWYTSTTEVR